MKKTMIYLLMLVFMSSGFLVAEESSSDRDELEKRLEELETLTKEMEVELDRIRRTEAVGSEDEVLVQKVQWGTKTGLELSGGIMGTGGMGTVGFVFPKISFGKDSNSSYLGISIKASIISDSIPARVFDDNGILVAEDSRFHILGGPSLTFGSPIFLNFVRVYGGFDLYGGTMLTVDNPYSGNLFLGGIGFGGIEIYTSKWSAAFIEGGGGGGGLLIEGDNIIAANNGHLGGGFIRVGSRFYF